jgi:hypothetical protein
MLKLRDYMKHSGKFNNNIPLSMLMAIAEGLNIELSLLVTFVEGEKKLGG